MAKDYVVPKDLVDKYHKDGAIFLKGVFDKDCIESIKDGIKKNMEQPSPFGERLKAKDNIGHYFNDYCNWTKIPEFMEYVYRSTAASIAGQLMKTEKSIFYHEHVLVKEPKATISTPWHHDQSYYPIDGEDICSIWMPVDPVPEEATLRFVKGSHRWGQWFFPRKFKNSKNYPLKDEEDKDLKSFKDVPADDIDAGKYEILFWACEPGDCVVFHGKMLHGAYGNASDTNWRRVLSTRWLGDDAKIATRPWDVSPPTTGGLKEGDPPSKSSEFPVIWTRGDQN